MTHLDVDVDEATWTGGSTQTVAPDTARATRTLTVIVPTRNEEGNVAPLLGRLERVAPGVSAEVLFVDDSGDGTPAAVAAAGVRCTRPVGLIHRPPERRADGLGGAVVEGLHAARGTWACVMDGDLQHPPEVIEDLLAEAERSGADLVVASRRIPHADDASLPRARAAISHATTWCARRLFGRRLAGVSDPMSGFFLVRRAALDLEWLRPHGFKILLEILVRSPNLRISEVPFHFGERHSGSSKADVREGLRFLRLLWRLRLGLIAQRFARFGLVGLTGLAVNTLALAALTEVGGVYYLLSAVLASQVSTLWNFCLTDFWVFRGRQSRRGRLGRLGLYALMNNAALALRAPMLFVLASLFGVHYLLANLLSLLVLTVVRFLVADMWIWAKDPMAVSAPASHRYDIHGVVNVRSEVALPELEAFRTEHRTTAPAIDVRIAAEVDGNAPANARRIRYREGIGFGVEIASAARIDVAAASVLRISPHVLYTNVVEPILRWTFVERGYALVHGACLAEDGRALLITARTDTGKTTTALKALEAGRWAFLSDDLTLLAPDGRVLAYPKPLTISRHTLKAVRRALLSRRECLALFVQSRIHSRSGRRLALLIARFRLPAATINVAVQALVPPPKYDVRRLVPGVTMAGEARLARMVVIERDGDGAEVLAPEEAVATLMANCEDAYGFPPYPAIAGFLYNGGEHDLRVAERAIVARALADVPVTLLRSRTMDWWRDLPRPGTD
jgi:dolichol-phosphate mannosyltransferase